MLIQKAGNLGIRSSSVRWRGTIIFEQFNSILILPQNVANATHYSTVASGQKKISVIWLNIKKYVQFKLPDFIVISSMWLLANVLPTENTSLTYIKNLTTQHIRKSTSTHHTDKRISLHASVEIERILSVYSQPKVRGSWLMRHVVGSNMGPANGSPR
jgi:hypothetical protein